MLKEIMFNQKPQVLLKKMLDKAALTQKVIASNIANVNTPGYKRLSVSFNSVLRNAVTNIKRTDPRHFPLQNANESIEPEIVIVEDGYWNGVNNVNIDQEMVNLAKNQLDFNAAARLMNLRLTQIRTAIRGRI